MADAGSQEQLQTKMFGFPPAAQQSQTCTMSVLERKLQDQKANLKNDVRTEAERLETVIDYNPMPVADLAKIARVLLIDDDGYSMDLKNKLAEAKTEKDKKAALIELLFQPHITEFDRCDGSGVHSRARGSLCTPGLACPLRCSCVAGPAAAAATATATGF